MFILNRDYLKNHGCILKRAMAQGCYGLEYIGRVVCFMAAISTAASAAQLPEPLYPRGVPIPSLQQQQKVRNLPHVRAIQLNALGLQRVNEARRALGKNAISSGPVSNSAIGDELSIVPASQMAVSEAASLSPDWQSSMAVGTTDNSKLSAFPPILSQGSQGACAAFSTTYYQMTHMTALVRGWDAKGGGTSNHFSPKWTYNMLNGGGDNGIFIDESLSLMADHGCARWSDFPYSGSAGDVLPWCMTPSVWSNAISFRLNSYSTLTGLSTTNGLAALKAVLDNGYVVTFDSYSPWSYGGWVQGTVGNDPATTNDNAFSGQLICKYVRAIDWGHAMTVVGYDDNIWCDLNGNGTVDSGEKGALKIANSWGTSWGNSGFAWFAYDALNTTSAVSNWNPADKVYGFGYGDSSVDCIAYVVVPRTDYNPRFLAKFTINHPRRGYVAMALGKASSAVTNNPADLWRPLGLNECGGTNVAFDGTVNGCDGTFFLDLTDLISDPFQLRRYFVGMSSVSGNGQLKSYTLSDALTGEQSTVTPSNAPVAFCPSTGIANAGTAWGWVDMGTAPSLASSETAKSNSALITIRDNTTATPYPSTITVSNMMLNPLAIRLTISGLAHEYPSDINMLLVGPGGQNVVLMTAVGGSASISNVTVTFDDWADASFSSSAILSSSYQPADYDSEYEFTAPAPVRPYDNYLAVFTNADPNGVWKLYVTDSAGGDSGSIRGGWTLTFSYPSPWIAWQTNAFSPLQLANTSVSDSLADPDHDGYCNLLEYAFNSNPWIAPSTPARLSVGMQNINGTMTPVFSYPRRAGSCDVRYMEETSTNLVGWSTNHTTFIQATTDTNGVTETVETAPASQPGSTPQLFFRVRVSL